MRIGAAYSLKNVGDKALLNLLAEGNEAAFEEIYDCYWERLFSIAANKLHSLTDAEELVQDVFLDLWRRREQLDIQVSLSAYLAVAVKYKVFDRIAKKANQQKYRQHLIRHHNIADCSTEHWIDYAELKEKVGRHVAELPEKCRLVFELSRDHGFSQKQIALKLGIAEKTVESHLGKALKILRINLGEMFLCYFFSHLLFAF